MAHVEAQTGFWRDYSKNDASGLTLTLSSSHGTILISFLALFVALIGARSWLITSFAIHRLRVKDLDRDGLYYQSQILIRNSDAELPLVSQFLYLLVAWRKHRTAAFRRLIPYILIGLVHFTAFSSAGLFSSRIALSSSDGNKVLVKTKNCGLTYSAVDVQENQIAANIDASIYFTRNARLSLDYAAKCYDTASNSTDCSIFAQRNLGYVTTHSTPCPFKPWWRCCGPSSKTECRKNPNRGITFDSGFIDTLSLGHNAPLNDRLLYRRLSTCAPLKLGPEEVYIHRGKSLSDSYIDFNIGGNPYGTNHTYRYWKHSRSEFLGYQISPFIWEDYEDYATRNIHRPIKDLRNPNADVSVAFLSSNSIIYNGPSDDPVFGANKAIKLAKYTLYAPDSEVTAMGCIDQHQVCNTVGNKTCSPLRGNYYLSARPPPNLFLSQQQSIAMSRIGSILSAEASILNTPSFLGTQALEAQNLVASFGQTSRQLRDNQWEFETARWFQTMLAQLQVTFPTYANQYYGLGPSSQTILPEIPNSRTQCDQQIMRVSASYTSFSVLGLIITLVIGFVVIGFSFTIDFVVCWFEKILHKGDVKRLQYDEEGILQTQRTAFERTDRGKWQAGACGIPIVQDVDLVFPHICKVSRASIPHADNASEKEESEHSYDSGGS